MEKTIKLNSQFEVDLPKLIDSRLLIQANSGGGKSWVIRRILEQSHGKVQQIVIDLEGEFSTLREKYDYILAGKGGDTPADPRSAALLAKKLLELNVSAIVDLYELNHFDRKRFVKLFLEAMVNAPKELWHPCLVIVDEAHVFCPEKGSAESSEAVIDLATRGRKRGYCCVLATQRLSKLHKDAAAECNNKLIGRTSLDVDMKRAYDELGFNTKEQYLSLRQLGAGEFFSFGPAMAREVTKIKIGDIQTTHPKAGSRFNLTPIAPTAKIKALLPKLSDLPAEAKKEASNIADLRAENTQLKRDLSIAKKIPGAPTVKIERIEIPAVGKRTLEKLKIAESNMRKMLKGIKEYTGIIEAGIEKFSKDLAKAAPPDKIFGMPVKIDPSLPRNTIKFETPGKPPVQINFDQGETKITGGALRMLKVLVSRYPTALSRAQLATFSKLSPRSGSFGTYLSTLRSGQLINGSGDSIEATQAGIDYLGEAPNPPQTSEEVIKLWQGHLKGGARRMFDILINQYPEGMTKEELGEFSGLSSSSGSFGTYLSTLRSNGLIDASNGKITASKNIFI